VRDRKTGVIVAESDYMDYHEEAINWGCEQGDSWPDSYTVDIEEES
jgi:hypothetical protein